MIWFLSFLVFFFLSLKEIIFFSSFLQMDTMVIFMVSISPLIVFLILFLNFNYFSNSDGFNYVLFFVFLIFVVSLSFLSLSPFLFLVLLESSVFPMSFLIMKFSKDSDKISAILFMMFINLMGSIPFMFFVSNFWFFNFSFLDSLSFGSFFLLDLFIFLGFIGVLFSKLPIFFFHFWLTKAHVSASGSCSMILASLMLKLGSFGLYKFAFLFFFCSLISLNLFLAISVAGSILISIVMIRFFDMKFIVACSSILHMSLISPLVLIGGSVGMFASVFMMVGHGLVSYFLFFLITLYYECSLNRSFDFNKSLESYSKFLPMISFVYIFMNLGVPPFLNFISELFFCSSLYFFSSFSLLFFLILMVISITFTMFFLTKILFGKKITFINQDLGGSLIFFSFSYLVSLFLLPFIF